MRAATRRALLGVVLLATTSSGCATPAVWKWAREPEPVRPVGAIESATVDRDGLVRVRFGGDVEIAWASRVAGLERLRVLPVLTHEARVDWSAGAEARKRFAIATLEPLPGAAAWQADERAGTLALVDVRVRCRVGGADELVQVLALFDSRTGRLTTTLVDARRPPPGPRPSRIVLGTLALPFAAAADALILGAGSAVVLLNIATGNPFF